MTTSEALWPKLRDKKYREHFVAAQAKQAIPFQIRALMKAQELSQAELADRSRLTQGVISRAANPTYGNLSLNTLVRIAAGFDVAFVGRFVPFSELNRWLDHLSAESAKVPSFEDEDEKLSEDAGVLARSADNKLSALSEASLGRQSLGNVEVFWRLTAPKVDPQPGTLHDFARAQKARSRPPSHSSAAESMAASQ